MNDQERTFTNCESHRVQGKCDPWVATLNPSPRSPLSPSQPVLQVKLSDENMNRADKICGHCPCFSARK
jgi:hypothetical protein